MFEVEKTKGKAKMNVFFLNFQAFRAACFSLSSGGNLNPKSKPP
jgi:hypothetical protein